VGVAATDVEATREEATRETDAKHHEKTEEFGGKLPLTPRTPCLPLYCMKLDNMLAATLYTRSIHLALHNSISCKALHLKHQTCMPSNATTGWY
jgi:hypothetical protein